MAKSYCCICNVYLFIIVVCDQSSRLSRRHRHEHLALLNVHNHQCNVKGTHCELTCSVTMFVLESWFLVLGSTTKVLGFYTTQFKKQNNYRRVYIKTMRILMLLTCSHTT